MTIIELLQILAAVGTILVGLVSLLRPDAIQGFTGIDIPGPRGRSEVRAVFGGSFIGIGLAPFLLGPAGYQALGALYVGLFGARLISLFLDRSFENSNLVSLAVEIIFGVVLLL